MFASFRDEPHPTDRWVLVVAAESQRDGLGFTTRGVGRFVLTCAREKFRAETSDADLLPNLGICLQLTREPSRGR